VGYEVAFGQNVRESVPNRRECRRCGNEDKISVRARGKDRSETRAIRLQIAFGHFCAVMLSILAAAERLIGGNRSKRRRFDAGEDQQEENQTGGQSAHRRFWRQRIHRPRSFRRCLLMADLQIFLSAW